MFTFLGHKKSSLIKNTSWLSIEYNNKHDTIKLNLNKLQIKDFLFSIIYVLKL